ncbi:hypothetical protein EDD39_4397 [Kitasatospora cineracea]|uniref:Uncharacterized protein n=1 Tax=Kitasatospora cineracea TaxID=88074 RepID=A0A8G1ULE3_9ACTN|nr:hypothetical protein EDD39_4397 [Kitasatospora cineracea]
MSGWPFDGGFPATARTAPPPSPGRRPASAFPITHQHPSTTTELEISTGQSDLEGFPVRFPGNAQNPPAPAIPGRLRGIAPGDGAGRGGAGRRGGAVAQGTFRVEADELGRVSKELAETTGSMGGACAANTADSTGTAHADREATVEFDVPPDFVPFEPAGGVDDAYELVLARLGPARPGSARPPRGCRPPGGRRSPSCTRPGRPRSTRRARSGPAPASARSATGCPRRRSPSPRSVPRTTPRRPPPPPGWSRSSPRRTPGRHRRSAASTPRPARW